MFFRRNKKTEFLVFCSCVSITFILYLILKNNDDEALVQSCRNGAGNGYVKHWAKTGAKYKYEYHRFVERQRHLQSRCSEIATNKYHSACEEEERKDNMKYVKEKNVLYCSIEKTGSTFWRRTLHIAGGWGNSSNPTHIELNKAYNENGGYRNMKNITWADLENLFKCTEPFLFVRNPFSRLFSGWLDKFYSPNVFYWNVTGRNILETQRYILGNNPNRCASDVSFVEFVNHTVNEILSSKCIDGHFSSMYSHCLPCNLSFRYVGKYETLKEDTFALIELLGLTDLVMFNDFETDAVFDAIADSSNWVYKHKEKVVACGVSFSCALYRVWSRLQSRGIISKKLNFPYNTKDSINILTQEQFELDIVKAHLESSTEDLKNNRHEALVQALKALPETVKEKVLLAFEIDFDLFDYDRNPFSLDESGNVETSAFTYFSNCPQQFR